MKRAATIILALSLTLNLFTGGFLVYQHFGLPQAQATNDIKEPGTYGPPAMAIIDGSTTISTAEVTLQNTIITGNLYLSEEIDAGAVALRQVEVQGEVIIAGGGRYDLLLYDSNLAQLVILENDGALTITGKGDTTVGTTIAGAEVSLQEQELRDAAPGFIDVLIQTDKKVMLLGDFANIDIEAAKASVKVIRGRAASINVKSGAANAVLEFSQDVQAESLVLEAVTSLSGAGSVQAVSINTPGLVRLRGAMGEVICRTEGIFLELEAGSIEKLVVSQLETAASITLAEDTYVAALELNARTGITGQGQVGTAVIKAAGVTMDQTPAQVDIHEGLTAIIGGEEYKVEPEPDPIPVPEPEPEPDPPKQSVSISSISGMTLLAGETGTRVVNVSPANAALTAISSNNGVVTVSLSGKTVTVTAKGAGTATITVKGTRTGYTSAARTFKVTVNGLTDVKEFRVEPGLSPGKSMVIVTLYDPNPGKYAGKLRIGQVVLSYLEEQKKFYGEVSTSEASAGNVRVD